MKETFLLPERMNEKSFFSPRFLGDFYQEPARVEQDVRDDKGMRVLIIISVPLAVIYTASCITVGIFRVSSLSSSGPGYK